jgi:hypothetical protein
MSRAIFVGIYWRRGNARGFAADGLLADGGDAEEIFAVAGDAEGGSGGDGIAGVVGDGAPDFSLDENVAGRGEWLHGGGYMADEGFDADEGFLAAGADGET